MSESGHAPRPPFDLVVLASSTGGVQALRTVVTGLPHDFPVPILIVQHLSDRVPSHLVEILRARSRLPAHWIGQGQRAAERGVWVAPPGYHVSIRRWTGRLTLSRTEPVNFVRPSADVLLQSAADCYGDRLLAVILTGSGRDGTAGAAAVKRRGGRVLAQSVTTCAARGMPASAIVGGSVDLVLPLDAIAPAVVSLVMVPGAADLLRVEPAAGDRPPNGMRAREWKDASTFARSRWRLSR
ncbi:MAG: chemotaxis protein CheB [Chloroflexi bacterium]|nr:chemotaxis protein CheB [Chloroflexota bacterium]